MSVESKNAEEQQARITQLQMDAMLKLLETVKCNQDIRYAPFTLFFTGIGVVTGIFAAALALLKWLH
jgi:hypothetical protein